jgi:hypothetical protein
MTSTTAKVVPQYSVLSPYWGSPIVLAEVPRGGDVAKEEMQMKIARRVILSLASVAALALAGGAHWRVG